MPTEWNDPSIIMTAAVGAVSVLATIGVYLHSRRKKAEAGVIDLPRASAKVAAKEPVAIGIVQRGKQVVLVRRSKAEKNLLWQFPAGVVKSKRTPEETIVKEVLKETGITCKVHRRVGNRTYPDTGTELVYFHCLYQSGELINGDTEENAEVLWKDAGAASDLFTTDIYPPVKELLVHVAEHRDGN